MLVFENGHYHLSAKSSAKNYPVVECKTIDVHGPWQLQFSEGKNCSPSLRLKELVSLHLHEDPDVRHFTGTVKYSKHIQIKAVDLKKDRPIQLYLGRVEVIAEVYVNERKVGICWKEPYCLDITQFVQPGNNELTIAVTNLWPNRLIGDEALPAENVYTKDNNLKDLPEWYITEQKKPGNRTTFCVWKVYDKEGPIFASGLMGPVKLYFGHTVKLL